MALKPQRTVLDTSIDFFMNETANRGGIVCVSTAGSGIANDQAKNVVTYVGAQISGVKPIGLLLNDVVNYDLTRQNRNPHRDEVQIYQKVTVMRKGTVVTDRIYPGLTPTGGDLAYVAQSGYISNRDLGTDQSTASRLVGRFESTKDEDGFAKVSVNLP